MAPAIYSLWCNMFSYFKSKRFEKVVILWKCHSNNQFQAHLINLGTFQMRWYIRVYTHIVSCIDITLQYPWNKEFETTKYVTTINCRYHIIVQTRPWFLNLKWFYQILKLSHRKETHTHIYISVILILIITTTMIIIFITMLSCNL